MGEDILGNQFTEIYETRRCQRLRSREYQNFGGESSVLEKKNERERGRKTSEVVWKLVPFYT
jgi:hypothetical protein